MQQHVTVRVEVAKYQLVGREVEKVEVTQAVGAHAECKLTFDRDPRSDKEIGKLTIDQLADATVRVVLLQAVPAPPAADGGAGGLGALAGNLTAAAGGAAIGAVGVAAASAAVNSLIANRTGSGRITTDKVLGATGDAVGNQLTRTLGLTGGNGNGNGGNGTTGTGGAGNAQGFRSDAAALDVGSGALRALVSRAISNRTGSGRITTDAVLTAVGERVGAQVGRLLEGAGRQALASAFGPAAAADAQAGPAEPFLAFEGRVATVEVSYLPSGVARFEVVARSASHALEQHVDTREYPQQTVPGLAAKLGVQVGAGVEASAARGFSQQAESAWSLLSRVAVDEGLQLRAVWGRTPDESVKTRAELARGFADTRHEVTWGRTLSAFAVSLRPTNHGVTSEFYDPSTKHDHRYHGVRQDPELLSGAKPFTAAARRVSTQIADGGDPGYVRSGGMGGTGPRTHDEMLPRLNRESAARLGSAVSARGTSTLPGLRAGDRLTVKRPAGGAGGLLEAVSAWGDAGRTGANEWEGEYGLTQVKHSWNDGLYQNTFEATPWAGYHRRGAAAAAAGSAAGAASTDGSLPAAAGLAALTGGPLGEGLAVGIVVANTDDKRAARVKVRFPHMSEGEATHLCRVLGHGAGNDSGFGIIPPVGAEVVTCALGGDPAHRVVLGTVWNGVDQAAHKPGRQHWVTPAGNTVVLLDGQGGQETIELYTPGGKAWVQLAQKGPGGGPTVTVHSEGDLSLEAPNGQVRIRAKSYLAHVAEEHATQVGGKASLKASGDVGIASSGALGLSGQGNTTVWAGATLHTHAGSAHAHSGSPMDLDPGGGGPPPVRPEVPALPASAWGARPIPAARKGRSTEDPKTPTKQDLAKRAEKASAVAESDGASKDVIDPQWDSPDAPGILPAPGGAAAGKPQPLTPEQQKLKDMKALLQQSPTGRDALAYLDKEKIGVAFNPNGGAYWDSANRRMVIDTTYPTDFSALVLVHETHHARMDLTKATGNIAKQSRADYVTTMLNEEAMGTVLSIRTKRELVAAGTPVSSTFALEPQYGAAYAKAVSALQQANPKATAAQLAQAGEAAGAQRVVNGFVAGQVPTSTTGQPYPVYYGSAWDKANPPKKAGK